MSVVSRDPWLDNAEMALITLVLVGHAWGLLPQVWHLPALVLISGYLSRHSTWSGRRLWLIVRTLVVPYAVVGAVATPT